MSACCESARWIRWAANGRAGSHVVEVFLCVCMAYAKGCWGGILALGAPSGCEVCIAYPGCLFCFCCSALFSFEPLWRAWIRLQQGCVTLHIEKQLGKDAAFRRGLVEIRSWKDTYTETGTTWTRDTTHPTRNASRSSRSRRWHSVLTSASRGKHLLMPKQQPQQQRRRRVHRSISRYISYRSSRPSIRT